MDAYDRCTNLEKKILPILLLSMVEAENFQTTHVLNISFRGSTEKHLFPQNVTHLQ
jgi:hypothetical protein